MAGKDYCEESVFSIASVVAIKRSIRNKINHTEMD